MLNGFREVKLQKGKIHPISRKIEDFGDPVILRICSFLPSATEMIYSLGLQDELYGVTHECDYPLEAKEIPKLTSSALPVSTDSKEIDSNVRNALRSGQPIYSLDYEALSKASPDIVFTQELCEVCAVSCGEIERACSKLSKRPEIVSLDTFTLKDILDSILSIGTKCDRRREAQELVNLLNKRIERATSAATRESETKGPGKKKVFFMEWIDPIMSGGHWMAELISRAGGDDIFATHGKKSERIELDALLDYAPEILIVAPCGFGVSRAEQEVRKKISEWRDLPAVKSHNVYIADGNAYYSRPGPRIIDGLEILTMILNPELKDYSSKYGEDDFKQSSLNPILFG